MTRTSSLMSNRAVRRCDVRADEAHEVGQRFGAKKKPSGESWNTPGCSCGTKADAPDTSASDVFHRENTWRCEGSSCTCINLLEDPALTSSLTLFMNIFQQHFNMWETILFFEWFTITCQWPMSERRRCHLSH